MDDLTLKRGLELQKLIKTTEENLITLQHWINNSKPCVGAGKTDFNYNLCISEHRDGSGPNCLDLARYFGNTELLGVIEKTLELQLKAFKQEYESL